MAYVHKTRLSGSAVQVKEVVGKVEGLSPVLVDDMISTGGTLVSAMKAFLDRGCLPRFTIAATHGLLVGDAVQQLASFPLSRMLLTDSIGKTEFGSLPIRVVSLKQTLAHAIKRLSPNCSIMSAL